jgi:Ran GTPase-activating protein (RanGAP) involved in mRNA processing and transport
MMRPQLGRKRELEEEDDDSSVEDSTHNNDDGDLFLSVCTVWRLPKIHTLLLKQQLEDNHLTILGARFPSMSCLTTIRLFRQELHAQYIQVLLLQGIQNHHNIKELSLEDCTVLNWSLFCQSLGHCKGIQSLDLDVCLGLQDALPELTTALQELPNLRRVILKGSDWASTPYSVDGLSSWIQKTDCPCQSLKLEGPRDPCDSTPLFSIERTPFYRALAANTSLRELHLAYSRLGDGGLLQLASYLRCNKTLVHLDLTENGIRVGPGFRLLCQALGENTSLETLHLRHNFLYCLQDLADGLCQNNNSTLRTLTLHGNHCFRHLLGPSPLIAPLSHQNTRLGRLTVDRPNPPWSSKYVDQIRWYAHLNWAGRHLLLQDNVPLGLWPLILERVNQVCNNKYHDQDNIPSVLFHLLSRGPVILARGGAN